MGICLSVGELMVSSLPNTLRLFKIWLEELFLKGGQQRVLIKRSKIRLILTMKLGNFSKNLDFLILSRKLRKGMTTGLTNLECLMSFMFIQLLGLNFILVMKARLAIFKIWKNVGSIISLMRREIKDSVITKKTQDSSIWDSLSLAHTATLALTHLRVF